MRNALLVMTLTCLWAMFGQTALACVCAPDPPNATPEQMKVKLIDEINRAGVVFSGEVVAVDTFRVTFKVDRVWKGDFSNEITMSTGAKRMPDGKIGMTSCHIEFELGRQYVVYASEVEGELQAGKCTGTAGLAAAGARVALLEELKLKEKRND